MAPGVRSRRLHGTSTGRKPLSRSRSGDGLWKGRRSSPNSSNTGRVCGVAAVVGMMFVVMIILVAGVATTVQISTTTLEDGSQGIQFQLRKRHPRNLEEDQFYESHNSDERVPEEGDDQVVQVESEEEKDEQQQQPQELEEEYDGGKYEEEEEEVQEGIDAARAELEAKEAEEREEARRQEEREEQIRREKDEQLAQLRAEKERLERQLREEEEQRLRAEEAAREAARLNEEEERRKEEDLARLKKLQEEKEAERLELLRKQEEMLREEELHRRQQAEEARRQRQIEQEQEIQRQREEERKLILERSRLRREQQARQEAERNKPHPQKAMHLQTPVHKEFMKDARTKYPDMPDQATISFCDLMRTGRPRGNTGGNSKDDKHGYVNPAVLILGMEDSSTDLMWHVISQILYPGRKTVRRTHELQTHATAVDYGMLDKMGEHHQKDFWNKVSEKSKGKWLVHVFCQQQQNDVAAGFPWLTTPDVITGNQKAHETLEIINTHLPKGSLKILRIKRNILDVIIRQAHHDAKDGKAKLDHKKIFARIRQLQSEQDKVDEYLRENNIPHLEVDFETLFPFDQWTDLVKNAQAFQSNSDHINVDWRQLSTPLENEWRDLLRYLKVFRPLSMFDILRDAMQTHEVNTFWIQREAIDKFGYTSNALQGTHYFPLVRKPQMDSPLLRKAQKTNDFWGEGDEM